MAIAALAACNKEEQVAVDQSPITFANAAVDNSVKSIDETYGTVALNAFNVYGTATGNKGTAQIFNGTEVSGTVGANDWSYSGTQYWIENATYKFVGVVDAAVETYDALFPTHLTVDNTKDALVSNVATRDQGTTIDDSEVSLQFKHLLSKAKFTFIDNADDAYTFKVTNIKISGVNVSGTYAIAAETWDDLTAGIVKFGNATNTTEKATVAAETIATGTGTTSHFAKLIVPGTYDMVITFDVAMFFDATEVSAWSESITLEDKALVANYSYNFTADLMPGRPIVFKVTSLEGWTDAPDTDIQ